MSTNEEENYYIRDDTDVTDVTTVILSEEILSHLPRWDAISMKFVVDAPFTKISMYRAINIRNEMIRTNYVGRNITVHKMH